MTLVDCFAVVIDECRSQRAFPRHLHDVASADGYELGDLNVSQRGPTEAVAEVSKGPVGQIVSHWC